MKTKNILFLIVIFAIFSLFTNCKNTPFKKSLEETLTEHKWKVTEWVSVPGQSEPTASEDLYERKYNSECKRDSYKEFAEDGTIFFHNICKDTITNSSKWAVEGNEKLLLTYPLWNDELQEYKGDTTYTWEVLDYSRKKIELKREYLIYEVNYTETQTLSSF